MTTKSNKPGDAATLRRQAEEKFAAKAGLPQKPDKPLSVEESQAALHELGVHQIELEMQNEELRRAQLELDTARERYFDLYDKAPVGYLTVTEEGLILEANFTASAMLGVSKSEVVKSPFSRFIFKEDQDAYYLQRKHLFAGDGKQDFDLRMVKTDRKVFWVHMTAVVLLNAEGTQVARVALSDISGVIDARQRFESSFRNNPALMAISSIPEMKFLDVNAAFLTTMGYCREDVIGKTSIELDLFPDSVQQAKLGEQLQRDGHVEDCELYVRHKNGRLLTGLFSGVLINNDGQQFMLTVMLDITDRKQAEGKLRKSEERHRDIIRTSMDGYLRVDEKGFIREVNETYCSMSGYGTQELLGMHISDLNINETQEASLRRIRELMKNGESRFESRHRRKNGSPFEIEVSVQYHPSEGGYFIVFLHDITRRKQAELALSESEHRFSSFMEHLPAIVFLKDSEGHALFVNKYMDDALGASQWLGKTMFEVFPDEFGAKLLADDMCVMASGYQKIEESIPHLDGTLHYYETQKFLIARPGLEPLLGGVSLDVTERNRVARALQTSEATLYEETERRRALFEQTPLGIVIIDTETMRILEFNKTAHEQLGYSHEEFSRLSLYDIDVIETPEETRARVGFVLQSGRADFETRHRTKQGEIRDVYVFAQTIKVSDRIIYQAIWQDITERKKAEIALRESEKTNRYFATIVGSSEDAIISKDLAGIVTSWNKGAENLYGYTALEMVGQPISILSPAQKHDEVPGILQGISRGEVFTHFETQRLKKDGTVIDVSLSISPMKDGTGKTIGASTIARDITARKRAEDELLASEERYRSIVDTAAEGIITTGLDGVITFANKRMAEITGYSIDELIGKVDAGLMLDSAPAEPMRSALSQYGLLSNEFEIKNKGGANRWVMVNATPLKDSSGHHVANVALFTDITDYKNAEAEQQKLREKAESSSRLAAVGEMAAGIAHEINNPLTGVIGFSELLAERQDLPADVKEDIQRISAGSARVKEIVKRMLTFSRQTKPKKSCVNINELIEATLDLRSYVLKTANIEVVKHFDPDLHCVVADAGQMQQVFLNLIVNAEYSMKQSHGRGNLTIATEKAGDRVRISFKDDGAGMTRDTREKVFNPFFTTKGVGEGTGLGLSVTRSIILEHNGTIEVESEPGKGATFTVILPINCSPENTDGDSSSDTASAMKVKSGRIIVVDDEEAITSLVKAVLSREGYRVDVVSDSTAACEMLDSTLYDAVLMDIRMPGISGIDIYNDIKSRRPELAGRFIFITADVSDDNAKAFLDTNELPYIVKPFDIKILLKMVDGLLLLE